MEIRQTKGQSARNSVVGNGSLIELHKLEQNILAISQRNRQKYHKILKDDPDYNVLFYEPNDKLRTEKAFKKELLLKQLDKLMDQESMFDKKLAQLKFLKEVESQEQDKVLDKEVNSYQTLRTVWARHQKTAIEAKNSADRLQSLNFTIGVIKNTVIAMKLKEENSAPSYSSLNQFSSNKNYQKFLQNYERSLMLNQDLRQQIITLSSKIHEKQEIQTKLKEKLVEKDKEIKQLKKIKEISQVDHKFVIAQLKQEIFLVEKKLQRLQKWKVSLNKNAIEQSDDKFKLYFQFNEPIDALNENLLNSKNTSKTLQDILKFLTENCISTNSSTFISNSPSQKLNLPSQDQENNEIIIPSLSLTEPNDDLPTSKKIPTDRPLKTKNLDLEKFVGNKIGNVKLGKLPANLNDQAMKKFVRKNSVLGTPRRLEPQISQRFIEPITNTTN